MIAELFIHHTATSPVAVFCSRMSARPSLLKSPAPTAFHKVPGDATSAPEVMVVLLMNQMAISPVMLYCSSMSDLPSALKSPVATTLYAVPDEPRTAPATIVI